MLVENDVQHSSTEVEKCSTLHGFSLFFLPRSGKGRKTLECLLRWKVARIRKCLNMDLRRARSAVGVANSCLRPWDVHVCELSSKAAFFMQKWVPNGSQKLGVGLRFSTSFFDRRKSEFRPQSRGGPGGVCRPNMLCKMLKTSLRFRHARLP